MRIKSKVKAGQAMQLPDGSSVTASEYESWLRRYLGIGSE
jgi:hypothetical protein